MKRQRKAEPAAPALRVLCLHGKGQCAEIFSQRVGALRKKARRVAQFEFVDAPFEEKLREGQTVAMRTWWRSKENLSSDWRVSRAAVARLWAERANAGKPFDGILGFSMGAMVAAALCEESPRLKGLKFVIAAGGPFSPALVAAAAGRQNPEKISGIWSLHIAGSADRVVPASSSAQLKARFAEADSEWYAHKGGHSFPCNAAACRSVVGFLRSVQARHISASPPKDAPESSQSSLAVSTGEKKVSRRTQDSKRTQPPISTERTFSPTEEQLEELSSIEMIFADTRMPRDPDSASARVTVPGPPPCLLILSVYNGYPDTARPSVSVEWPEEGGVGSVPDRLKNGLARRISDVLRENEGSPVLFAVISEVSEWLTTAAEARGGRAENFSDQDNDATVSGQATHSKAAVSAKSDDDDDDAETLRMIQEATEEAAARDAAERKKPGGTFGACGAAFGPAQQKGGRWDFVIGLVGKPSAGKSTFFNAVTDPKDAKLEAKIGAYPFTTIEPNVGVGWFGIALPGTLPEKIRSQFASAVPAGALDADGRRLVPVRVKDVAGLVPGAYQGRGRGNAFLNDLCDADVLIHIVDASGTTDKQGNAVGTQEAKTAATDPLKDIEWVRMELHRWISDNIFAKMDTIRRKPERVRDMFTGYQCSPTVTDRALERMGVAVATAGALAEAVRSWGARDVHRLVAHFLRVRFPILLALNKMDIATARANAARIQQALPTETTVEVRARAEWETRRSARTGKDPGSLRGERDGKGGGGTGVHQAITAAVALKKPLVVYPVAHLETCVPYTLPAKHRPGVGGPTDGEAPASGGPTVPLRDCLLMLPGSSAEDLFRVLKNPPLLRVDGDYIRAELRVDSSGARFATRVLKKTDPLLDGAVVRVLTNKKVSWQRHGRSTQIQ